MQKICAGLLQFFELSFFVMLIESRPNGEATYPENERSKAMQRDKKSLGSLLGLILVVSMVLAYVAWGHNVLAGLINTRPVAGGPVTVRTSLVQDKVLAGSDGQVAVSLTLNAARIPSQDDRAVPPADLVIVLDRSGSMQGQKIDDARQAVLRMVDRLTAKDRLAVVAYSDSVQLVSPLTPMDDGHRRQVATAIQEIYAGGGTNLGGGLQHGIDILRHSPTSGRQRKVIMISDGLANQGITDPYALGAMAGGAMEGDFTVSTVGVGYDFNEILMTTIADHGAGRYYFLENPRAFAQVFEKELASARHVAAADVEIQVPLENGLQLIQAGGYPVQVKDAHAVIHPGDLLSGQQRTLFLTFKVPVDQERTFILGAFDVTYQHHGAAFHLRSRDKLTLACVTDKKAVLSSIDQGAWGDQVVQEDYNRLKENVADAIRQGEKGEALRQIRAYETRNRAINAAVGSAKVAGNLDKDVKNLQQSVEETFAGPAPAVEAKKKQTSKTLQYESYQIRRDKK
jgi:Ca-activated chloride channel homolog